MLRHEAEHPYNPNPSGCSSRGRGHRQNINLLIIVAGGPASIGAQIGGRERLRRMFFVSSPTASGPRTRNTTAARQQRHAAHSCQRSMSIRSTSGQSPRETTVKGGRLIPSVAGMVASTVTR